MPFQRIISQTRGFKMGSLNIASLVKHFDELQVFMEEEPFDVLAINETRLDSSILDCIVLVYQGSSLCMLWC